MAAKLTADGLFRAYFWPLYPADAKDLARARALDANPAKNPSVLAHLDDAATTFSANANALFGADLDLDRSDASVHRLSAALTPERRDGWIASGGEGTGESALFNVVVHGAAYLGACITARHGGIWQVRRPLWESFVKLTSRAGEADLAVFHWWLKSLADDSTETLADRYRTHVETPCATPETLPIIAPPSRVLPRLSKAGKDRIRYDVLFKYFKAHLPELRDLGTDFPSPERFDELAFRWLDVHLLGEGRMVLLSGPGAKGLYLFWLHAAGFEKSLYYPTDKSPDPTVRVKKDDAGEKLEVSFTAQGKPQTHEILWWGP